LERFTFHCHVDVKRVVNEDDASVDDEDKDNESVSDESDEE